MDFLEQLKTHLESLDFTPAIINIGKYNENKYSLAIVVSPSNINDRYMEGGKIYPFSFQLLMHDKNHYTAYTNLQKLVDYLENINSSVFESDKFILISIKTTTTTNFVQETEFGALYTAIMNAELYIKGGK